MVRLSNLTFLSSHFVVQILLVSILPKITFSKPVTIISNNEATKAKSVIDDYSKGKVKNKHTYKYFHMIQFMMVYFSLHTLLSYHIFFHMIELPTRSFNYLHNEWSKPYCFHGLCELEPFYQNLELSYLND